MVPSIFLSSPTVKVYEQSLPLSAVVMYQLENWYGNLTDQFLPSATVT